jgi:transcriptional regulator with XRE-family HTH domain
MAVASFGITVPHQQHLAVNQRRLRVAIGLSQGELAAAAGVGKATISGIEQERANPRLETLAAIAAALRVEVGELLAPAAPPAVEVVRARRGEKRGFDGFNAQVLAAGAMSVHVPARRERELPAEEDGWRFLLVLEGRLISGPVEAPTELDAGDSAAFPATGPMLLRTGRRPARALVLTMRA